MCFRETCLKPMVDTLTSCRYLAITADPMMVSKVLSLTNSDINVSPSLAGLLGRIGVFSSSSLVSNCSIETYFDFSGIFVAECLDWPVAAQRALKNSTG